MPPAQTSAFAAATSLCTMTFVAAWVLCRWVGLLTSYLLRPSAKSLQRHADFRSANGWQSPVVGVHIRRTDKVTSAEAKLHSIDEYMMHVERFCDWTLGAGWQQEQKAAAEKAAAAPPVTAATASSSNATAAVVSEQTHDRCTIYLATDEPAVVKEIEDNFGHIHVITNKVALDTGEAHTIVACKLTTKQQTA